MSEEALAFPFSLEPTPAPTGTIASFPCVGQDRTFHVLSDLFDQHRAAFPDLDINLCYKRALLWIEADPKRRKTANGMRRFLLTWLEKTQNAGVGPFLPKIGAPSPISAFRKPQPLSEWNRKCKTERLAELKEELRRTFEGGWQETAQGKVQSADVVRKCAELSHRISELRQELQ